MEEIWRDAKYISEKGKFYDFSGLYEVSNLGNVRSVDRWCASRFNEDGFFVKGQIMKQSFNKKGYLFVSLRYDKRRSLQVRVHRLVASTFQDIVGKWFKGATVNHKKENRKDLNSVDNLEWLSQADNNKYGTRGQRQSQTQINGKHSKPIFQYTTEGVFVKEWVSATEIQRELGYNRGNIGKCCNKNPKYKTAYGYVWKYKRAA